MNCNLRSVSGEKQYILKPMSVGNCLITLAFGPSAVGGRYACGREHTFVENSLFIAYIWPYRNNYTANCLTIRLKTAHQ